MAPNMESKSKEDWNSLLINVILPRVLPVTNSRHFGNLKLDLLYQMVETVKNSSEWIPSKTVELFKSLEEVQLECTPEVIAKKIRTLCPGDTFAMYIHRQNCAIMVYMPKNQKRNVVVATFPGNLPSSEIYKHESDIEVIHDNS